MEVQDTTNFLQKLLNIRLGAAPVVKDDAGGFADMLQADKQPENVAATEYPVALREEIRVADSIKDKDIKDIVKSERVESEKEPIEAKEPARRDDKKTKKADDKSQPAENEASSSGAETPAAQAESQESPAEGSVDDGAETTAAEMSAQPAGETAATAGVGQKTSEVALSMMQTADVLPETMPEMPLANTDTKAAETAVKTVAAATDAPAQLAAEEALLLEQARYLDKKVVTDGKLKIEVNVEEAKIAAPVAKDVFHNRFDFASFFQNVDAETILADAEPAVLPDEGATVLDNVKNNTNILPNMTTPKGVAVFEPQLTPQHAAKEAAADNAQVLSVSGKEVVFETSNTARAETFARLNETASRDTFKGMSKEVVEQIKVNITKSAVKGVDTIDIQLKPEDLGKIQIKMHIAKDGRLHADIIASRPETIDMLQKDISGLEKAFNDAGYNADSRSFNFSFQKENQAGEQQKADSGRLQFIGDTLEQEAEGVAGNDNLVWDPVLGLNIKV